MIENIIKKKSQKHQPIYNLSLAYLEYNQKDLYFLIDLQNVELSYK